MLGFELTASNSSGGDYELPSAGNHAARIVGVINGGTHETAGINGQPRKKAVKLLLLVELPYEPRSDGKPFVVLYECSASLHVKATLRKLVHEVLNRPLNEGDKFTVTRRWQTLGSGRRWGPDVGDVGVRPGFPVFSGKRGVRRWQMLGRVDLGGRPPRSPTDPDVRVKRIWLFIS